MNDQAVARCQEMKLDKLVSFIEDSLEKLYEPDPGWDRPHTYEEFLVVWRLLRKKTDSTSTDPSPPRNPLEKAYAKRRRTKDLLYNEAPGNPKFKKKDLYQMERTLNRLDREIEEMETSTGYNPPPTLDTKESQKHKAAQTSTRLFEDIESTFKAKVTGRRLQWRPARPGTLSVGNIARYYEEKRRWNPEIKYDLDRIEKAKDLGPDDPPWLGPDGFDGYVIFTFPGTRRALMECPEIGNAAYVIHKDWENWSQMDKQELMAEAESGGDVTRIPHWGDDWPARIRSALGLGEENAA